MRIKTPSSISSAWKSAILLALTYFPLSFLHILLHEGGHALVAWAYGTAGIRIFVHPFAFSGYSRPIFDAGNILFHAAGPLSALAIPLVVFLFTRRFRSAAGLFLTMLLPWCLFWEGLNMASVLMGAGDFYNLSVLTGLPVALFAALGFLLILAGILMIGACLPSTGLRPDSNHAFWAIPASFVLWVLPGNLIARFLVPHARFAVEYQLAEEIAAVAGLWLFVMAAAGLLIAGAYATLFRRIARRHPERESLQAADVPWRALFRPAVWCAASIVFGICFIVL
jgi:hypothetical protein